jgi:putative ABC transport system ATP-binding protein
MNRDAPIIQVRNLTKIFRVGEVDVHALRGINLDVGRGEFLTVVGSSGSGKSTLFHIMGGLTHPTGGSVMIDGQDLFGLTDAERTRMRRSKVGFVFQRYNLLPTLTAAGNIEIARYLAGNNGALDDQFRETLELLGIAHRLDHKPSKLSGGEQQRVAIARALVNRPAILLADEPTGNLDSKNTRAVLDLLRRLNEQLKQTILLITHELAVAEYGHRTVHIQDGQILEEAQPLDL